MGGKALERDLEKAFGAAVELHEIFNHETYKPLINTMKKGVYDGRPMVIHNGRVIGGFASYYHSIRTNEEVASIGYDGPDSKLHQAIYILNSIASELLIYNNLYDSYTTLYNKILAGIEKAQSEKRMTITKPLLIYPVHEMIKDFVDQGALYYYDAVAACRKTNFNDQRKIAKIIRDSGLDIQQAFLDWLNNDLLPTTEKNHSTSLASREEPKQGYVVSTRLEEIEARIRELDQQVVKAVYEKAKLLTEIHQKRLYKDRGFDNFQDYYSTHLEISKTQVYRLMGMYSKTPNLLPEFPYKRLVNMNEWLPTDVLRQLDDAGEISRLSGEVVSVKQLESCSFKDFTRILIPWMKPQAKEKFVRSMRGDSIHRAKEIAKKLRRQLNELSPDEQKQVLAMIER